MTNESKSRKGIGWIALAGLFFLLALLAFLGGGFAQIIVCEYDHCAEEKREALMKWWGSAVVFVLGGIGSLVLSRPRGGDGNAGDSGA